MLDKKNYTLGIDIGANNIKIALLSYTENNTTLEKYIIQRTPSQFIENGIVIYPEELGQIINSLLAEYGIKCKNVSFSTPFGDDIGNIKVTSLPNLKKKELSKAIISMIEDELLMPIEKIYYNWEQINVKKIDGQELAEVLLVGASKVAIDNLLSTVKTIKMKPYYAELDIFSIMRAIDGTKGENIAIIDIGYKQTKVCLYGDNLPPYSRVIPHGGLGMIQSIAEEYSKDFKSAEFLLQEHGALCTNQYPFSNFNDLTFEEKECSKIISKNVDVIIDEIKTTLDFNKEYSNIDVDKLVLVGSFSKTKGITNYFNANIGYKTEIINIPYIGFSDAFDNKETVLKDIPAIAGAIGLALKEVKDNV